MWVNEWGEKILKKFKWYDVKLAQWTAMFALLTVITAWPAFLELVLRLDWYWYLLGACLSGAPLVKRVFFD